MLKVSYKEVITTALGFSVGIFLFEAVMDSPQWMTAAERSFFGCFAIALLAIVSRRHLQQ